jgi:Na+-driven multidrug efflux pump
MTILKAYAQIFLDAFPIMVYVAMEVIINTINLHFCTNITMRAGLGCAIILIHSFGGLLVEGFNQAYVNFASKAFGANNKQKYSHYLFQGILTVILIELFVIMVGFLSYQLCMLTNQSP